MSTIVEKANEALAKFAAGNIASRLANTGNYVKDTCFHECGHAAIILFLGGRIFNIEIREDGSGVCREREPEPGQPQDNCSDQERAQQIHWLLEQGGDPAPDALEIEMEIESILRAHWSFIKSAAESLYSRLVWDSNRKLIGALMGGSELLKRWEFSLVTSPKGKGGSDDDLQKK